VLEAGTPRFAEHAFEDADDFGADIGFAGFVGDFERVEGNWILSIRRVEVDDVFEAILRDEFEVANGKVAVRVDDAVALIVENIREGKEFE